MSDKVKDDDWNELLKDPHFLVDLLKDPEAAVKSRNLQLSPERLAEIKKHADKHRSSFSRTVRNSVFSAAGGEWPQCPDYIP
jgi:hypothetical protein